MSGRRQHFLPRFLQRPFSHKRASDVEAVFVHRKNKSFASNLMGIGQEKDFYGGPEDQSLDDAITAVETRLAAVVQKLNGTDPRQVCDADCATLISAMSMRTRAMRKALTEAIPVVVLEAANQFGDVNRVADVLRAQANDRAWLRGMVSEELNKMPLMPREQRARVQHQVEALVRSQFSDPSSPVVMQAFTVMQHLLARLQEQAKTMADQALIKALRSDPTMPARAENLFRGFSFQILVAPEDEHFILGDCAVVAMYSDGVTRLAFGSMDENTDIDAFFLPLSPSNCLVASREGFDRITTPATINVWSASLSQDFFLSHAEKSIEFAHLRTLINTADPIDTEDRLRSYIKG